MLERKPACERGLAEQQHRAGISVAGGDVAHRRERGRIRRSVTELGEPAGDEVPLADGVEDLDGAHDFQPSKAVAPIRCRLGRRPYHDVAMAEPRAGDLAVIGGRVARRGLVVGAGLVVAAERLGGAALPVAGARQRDRVAAAGLLILAKWPSAACGSLRNRNAIQPAVNWLSTR